MVEKNYRIGEAADIVQLKSHVLRFWETEFTQLAPLRSGKQQRLYTEEHLDLLKRIKFLLYEQGMTIDGAKRVLQLEQNIDKVDNSTDYSQQDSLISMDCGDDVDKKEFSNKLGVSNQTKSLQNMREELLALRNLLITPIKP